MDNEELKEFSRCLSGLDDASKRLLLFKLVEMAYEGEEHTHVNVSPLVAYKMSSVTGCDVLCEIQTLVKYLKQLAVAQDYGSDMLRDLTVYSAVWHAADAKVSEKNVPSTRKLHERPREGTERPRRVLMDSFPSGPAGPLIAALWGSRNETAYFCLCNWARVGLCGPAQIPVGCLQYLFARRLMQRPDCPPGRAACISYLSSAVRCLSR